MVTKEMLHPPVDVENFFQYFLGFMSVGLVFTAWFFTLQFAAAKQKSLAAEVIVSAIAAVFTGLGFLFLLLWAGIYI